MRCAEDPIDYVHAHVNEAMMFESDAIDPVKTVKKWHETPATMTTKAKWIAFRSTILRGEQTEEKQEICRRMRDMIRAFLDNDINAPAGQRDLAGELIKVWQRIDGSDQIDAEVGSIATSASKIDGESRSVSLDADDLFKLSERLTSELARFKIS